MLQLALAILKKKLQQQQDNQQQQLLRDERLRQVGAMREIASQQEALAFSLIHHRSVSSVSAMGFPSPLNHLPEETLPNGTTCGSR